MGDRLDELKSLDFVSLCFTVRIRKNVDGFFRLYLEGASLAGNFTRGLFIKPLLGEN
jgi:hypothetical protein